MKGNSVCRVREIHYAEHIMIVCIGGEIQYAGGLQVQCAKENKYSVQMRRNAVFRGVQIHCSEEYKYSVQRSTNTVCRRGEIQCA